MPRSFESQDHEAKFWDNTELTEIKDSVRTVDAFERPVGPLSATFAIRVDARTLEEVRDLATLYNVGPTQLVRGWIVDRLNLERRVGGLAPHSTGLDPNTEINFRRHAVENVIEVLPDVADRVLATALQEYDGARYAFESGLDEGEERRRD